MCLGLTSTKLGKGKEAMVERWGLEAVVHVLKSSMNFFYSSTYYDGVSIYLFP